MTFKIVDVIDVDVRFTHEYSTLDEAVQVFASFKDHGNARFDRVVALVDKDGEVITRKEFRA